MEFLENYFRELPDLCWVWILSAMEKIPTILEKVATGVLIIAAVLLLIYALSIFLSMLADCFICFCRWLDSQLDRLREWLYCRYGQMCLRQLRKKSAGDLWQELKTGSKRNYWRHAFWKISLCFATLVCSRSSWQMLGRKITKWVAGTSLKEQAWREELEAEYLKHKRGQHS